MMKLLNIFIYKGGNEMSGLVKALIVTIVVIALLIGLPILVGLIGILWPVILFLGILIFVGIVIGMFIGNSNKED